MQDIFPLCIHTRVFHILGLHWKIPPYAKMHPRCEAVERKAVSQGGSLFLLLLHSALWVKYSAKHWNVCVNLLSENHPTRGQYIRGPNNYVNSFLMWWSCVKQGNLFQSKFNRQITFLVTILGDLNCSNCTYRVLNYKIHTVLWWLVKRHEPANWNWGDFCPSALPAQLRSTQLTRPVYPYNPFPLLTCQQPRYIP